MEVKTMENKQQLLEAISELIGWVEYMEKNNLPIQFNSLEEMEDLLVDHALTITDFLTEE